jgi:hypothetical protein
VRLAAVLKTSDRQGERNAGGDVGSDRPGRDPLAYRTWQFGGNCGPVDERAAVEVIGHARLLGVNFFDTAQACGFGQVAETRADRC